MRFHPIEQAQDLGRFHVGDDIRVLELLLEHVEQAENDEILGAGRTAFRQKIPARRACSGPHDEIADALDGLAVHVEQIADDPVRQVVLKKSPRGRTERARIVAHHGQGRVLGGAEVDRSSTIGLRLHELLEARQRAGQILAHLRLALLSMRCIQSMTCDFLERLRSPVSATMNGSPRSPLDASYRFMAARTVSRL